MKELMQQTARAVEEQLPEGTGFFVLAFNFWAAPGAPAQYVSNARREDVIKAMHEFLERNPMPIEGNN